MKNPNLLKTRNLLKTQWLSQTVVDRLLQSLAQTVQERLDRLVWNSSASLRKAVQTQGVIQIPWKRVWKFKGPTKASYTLWMGLHRALPTASLLWRRHVLSSLVCTWCNGVEQTPLHLLRDCVLSRAVC